MSRSVQSASSALEFDTERLRVRCISDGDEALFCGLYTDADTMRFIGKPLLPNRAARRFRNTVASLQDHPLERAFLTIVKKSTHRAIGICAINQFDVARIRAEVGMMLQPTALSQGYSKECLGELVAKTFAVFPIDEVWVQYSPGHSAAERLVVSLGFSPHVDVEPSDESSARRVWSLRRPSTSSTNAVINQGDDNVERHQFS